MSVAASRPRPAVLCILDGWGWRPGTQDNAIAAAATPNYTRMLADSPHALLATSGRAVDQDLLTGLNFSFAQALQRSKSSQRDRGGCLKRNIRRLDDQASF